MEEGDIVGVTEGLLLAFLVVIILVFVTMVIDLALQGRRHRVVRRDQGDLR